MRRTEGEKQISDYANKNGNLIDSIGEVSNWNFRLKAIDWEV